MRRALLVLPLLLAGCMQPVEFVRETTPAPLPEDIYRQAQSQGAAVFRVDPAESLVLIRVGRAGRAKNLGHDHAIASEDLEGFILLDENPEAARADIAFPARNLIVDKAAYRERLSLDTEPSANDIAGTYTNMLKTLEPDTYPWVTIRASVVPDGAAPTQLSALVTFHGFTAEYRLPIRIEVAGDRLVAEVDTVIRHSDFGVDPYSAAGGLLRVADELGIHFRIVARRLDGG